MGKRKRRIEGFAFYDYRGICNHLEQMAEKGWKIRQIGVFWEYEAIEPRKMHFAVSCCAGEDGYFKGDKGEILHLEKWRLVCRSGEMAIFCCEEEEAPPFGSMAKEELEAVHTIMKKRNLPSWLLVFATVLLQEWIFFSALRRDLVGQLADMGAILGSVCFFIVILIFLGEMIRYFKWYFPAKKEVLKGVFPVVKGSGRIGKAMFGALVAVLAWCIKGRSGCEKGRFRQKLEGQSGPWEVSPFPFLCWDLSQSEYGRHLKKEYLFQRRKKHMNTGEEPRWYLRMSFRYHWRI